MSTRCQIGFYESTEQTLAKPSALIYRHSDGYPDTEYGVVAQLLPWAKAFEKKRGLSDAEYAAARGLIALVQAADTLYACIGYGICGDHELHGDIQYYYRVDPSGISVYDRQWAADFADIAWASLYQIAHYDLNAKI
jgi:hypothetical protein